MGWKDHVRGIPLVGPLIAGPQPVDTSSIDNEKKRQADAAAAFAAERAGVANGTGGGVVPGSSGQWGPFGRFLDAAHDAGITSGTPRVAVDTSYIDPLRGLQTTNLGTLNDAALGNAPSAAEIQGRQQAATGAAREFGIATALQGRTPGGALNAAENGAATVMGKAGSDAAILRAQEQAEARKQYTDALVRQRDQEQTLGTTNANLDLDQQKMLLQAQLMEEGFSAEMARAIVDAKTKEAASNNAFFGGLYQTIGSAGAAGARGGAGGGGG